MKLKSNPNPANPKKIVPGYEISYCAECDKSYNIYHTRRMSCGRMGKELINYPVIPKDCPLKNSKMGNISNEATILGKLISVSDFIAMIDRVQDAKNKGENLDKIITRECALNLKTDIDREKDFLKCVWNNENLTWVNLNSENEVGIKCKFSQLPIGAPYKCLETGEIYYLMGNSVADWTTGNKDHAMNLDWGAIQ